MNPSIATSAKKKLYLNLLAKLNAGKTLSANERAQLDELGDLFSDEPKQQEQSGNVLLTATQTAKLFRVTTMTLTNWCKAGMPKAGHGRYGLFDIMDWWQENINKDPSDAATSDARGRYWSAKAEQAEIDVEIKKGLLISKVDVVIEWVKRVGEVRQGLLSLPVRIPPITEGKTQEEIRDAVESEVFRVLDAYSRDGRYTAAQPAAKRTKAKKAKRRK